MLNRHARAWADARTNDLERTLAEVRAAGHDIIDLVSGKSLELQFPPEELAAILNAAGDDAESFRLYKPDPKGRLAAREAISEYYKRRGTVYTPDNIVLTPGTSTAYMYLLSLLCEPGDDILVPQPGYPLFDDLAATARVHVRHYHLRETGMTWGFDPEEIAFQITPRTRAIMLVSPHNPMGLVLAWDELEEIGRVCYERGIAAVFDEVFCEVLCRQEEFARPTGEMFPLAFTLNGFSKMFWLPGMKVGWIAVSGVKEQVDSCLRALEYLSDTFLPNNELVQSAIPRIISYGDPLLLEKFRESIDSQRVALRELPLPACPPDGGVYVCMVLPDQLDDNDVSIQLLRDAQVLVHPGYLYGLPSHLVMTCLESRPVIQSGLLRIKQTVNNIISR